MQCCEYEALRLLLWSDTLGVYPDASMDPLLLGDVLDEFDVRYVRTYLELDPEIRMSLIDRFNESTPRRKAVVPERWKSMEAVAAHHGLRTPKANPGSATHQYVP